MADSEIINHILHYKKNIDKIATSADRALKNEERLLHCINKLLRLPINTNHLQETGVGRTINALRKIEGTKGLGHAARALVAKWKHMVLMEEAKEADGDTEELKKKSVQDEVKRVKSSEISDKSSSSQPVNKNRTHRSENQENEAKHSDRKRKHSDDEVKSKKLCSGKNESSDSVSKLNGNSSNHRDSSKLSSSKDISKSEKTKHSSHSPSKHSSSSSSKHHSSSSSTKDKHRNETDESKKSTESKKDSKKKKKEDESIDSSSGASFADALGPMVMKKAKKKVTSVPVLPTPLSKPSTSTSSSSFKSKPVKSYSPSHSDLLSPSELEPLDLDLMDSLPTSPQQSSAPTLSVPTPHYKPLPSVPSDLHRKKIQSEDDALISIMSNKNQRTKVYSGVKGGLLYVPSLNELCCRVLVLHIDALEYTGGIPYSIMKPVLENASPTQLFNFEHYNPYIIEDTDHLWEFHVKREFRNKTREECESWREMYLRCFDEREQKYKAVTANIQKSIQQSVPVRTTKLAYVDNAKPPRNILKKQLKNGTSKPDTARLLGKLDPEVVRVPAPKQCVIKEPPAMLKVKPKAPLMQKTLKSIKMSRFKR